MTAPRITAPTCALERLASLHAPADLGPLALEVLCFLLRSMGRVTMQTWYGQVAIAARLRRSERAVRDALAQLETAGLIHRLKRNRATGRLTDLTTVLCALELERRWREERVARAAVRAARRRPPARAARPLQDRPSAKPANPQADGASRAAMPPSSSPGVTPQASSSSSSPTAPASPPARPARGPSDAAPLAAIVLAFTQSQPAPRAAKGTSGVSAPSGAERPRRDELEPRTPDPLELALPPDDAPPLEQAATFRRALCDATGTRWRPPRAVLEPRPQADQGRSLRELLGPRCAALLGSS